MGGYKHGDDVVDEMLADLYLDDAEGMWVVYLEIDEDDPIEVHVAPEDASQEEIRAAAMNELRARGVPRDIRHAWNDAIDWSQV